MFSILKLGATEENVSVLLVEDETLIRMELEDAIREGGYSPVSASTGEDAIARLGASDGIRAIVTDINLGNGIMS